MQTDAVCFRTRRLETPWDLEAYRALGGYVQWEKILKENIPPAAVLAQIKASGLRGRGGAAFSTALKWGFVNRDQPVQKYIICNSDEGEPGTCKDHVILMDNPHQLIEGIAIAAYVLGASVGYHYLRGEFYHAFQRCEQALKEAYQAGLLGVNLFGSGFNFELHNTLGAGAYICGEETALLESLEGKRGWPRYKPPFPAHRGLYGLPTTVNNTETLASVPVILQHGAPWFSKLGGAEKGGSKIFSVSGHVNQPGNYEVPLGIPFKELLAMAGGVRQGRALKAVIPGGSSMPVLPASVMMETDMDYDSVAAAGSMLGTGAVVVMDETTCMVRALLCLSEFYNEESCGQCTPCREGAGWIARVLHRLETGKGVAYDLERLDQIARGIEGRTICAFGEAIAWPVLSFLKHFRDEFVYHIEKGCCNVKRTS